MTMAAFSIWPITIYRYGIMYLIGFSVGYIFLATIAKYWITKQRPQIHYIISKRRDELIIAIILGGIIGWRLGEVIIYELPYYLNHPDQIRAVRNGGMSFIGWIIGALIGIYILLTRLNLFHIKNRHKQQLQLILRLLDHIAVITPFGIMLWRIGNFINKELFGLVVYNKALLSSTQSNTRFTINNQILFIREDIYNILEKLKLIYDYDTSLQFPHEVRLNTNILASVGEGLIILIIVQILYRTSYRKGKLKPWSIAFTFLFLYSAIRFLLEYLRHDSQWYMRWILSNSQRFFLAFMSISIAFLVRPSTKKTHW